jgi:hypothetical protein
LSDNPCIRPSRTAGKSRDTPIHRSRLYGYSAHWLIGLPLVGAQILVVLLAIVI